MAQETTKEFANRLNQAVEGHPMAPATPFGRQSWLREKLIAETGLRVSPNTMSKWFHGQAMPRADNVRKIAQVLSVDDVWISMGRRPVPQTEDTKIDVGNARGAVLVLAGLLEMSGGRVTFADAGDGVDLQVNLAGRSLNLMVVSPKQADKTWSYIVPEPVGEARIVSVTSCHVSEESAASSTANIHVIDLTDCPRQSLGGYSVISLGRRNDGRFKAEGQRVLLSSISSLEELAM